MGHLKRLAAPKIWQIQRKKFKFITKPAPGPHPVETGTSLGTVLKETMNYAGTKREVKRILNTTEIMIDGRRRKDFRFPVGVFDIIAIPGTGQYFRLTLNKNGVLDLVSIGKEEASIKPCKIIGKTIVNGKLQLNLFDGNNITAEKEVYNVGDTLILSMPEKKITKHLKIEKKSSIFLIGGKHIGDSGIVEDIVEDKIIYRNNEEQLIETSKKYAFVVGDSKPIITIKEK